MRPILFVVFAMITMSSVFASSPPPVDLPGQAPDDIVQASTQAQEPPKPDIDIEVNKEETRRDAGWYVHPMTIGIGLLALLVIVFLLATFNRGGPTVVRP